LIRRGFKSFLFFHPFNSLHIKQNKNKKMARRQPTVTELMYAPDAKRPRVVSPFEISAEAEENVEQEPPFETEEQDGHRINRYIRRIDSDEQHNARYLMTQSVNTYMIEEVPEENPEGMLYELFEECCENAKRIAHARFGFAPDRLGATIASVMLNPPIWIPIRPIQADTVDNILAQFEKVMQSKRADGDGNLLGEPFTVTVHALCSRNLPQNRRIVGRGGRRQREHTVHHRVRECALIKVDNRDDGYCLFHALELTRIYAMKEKPSKEAFYKFLNFQRNGREQAVSQLMADAGVPRGQGSYDAVVNVPKVVDAWNRLYAVRQLRFKVFVFGPIGSYKADFCYGEDDFNMAISIYHDGREHFHGVRNTGKMFGEKYNYCYACQSTYQHASEHNMQCKSKCNDCGRVGIGRPCLEDPAFAPRLCQHCGRTYRSQECFSHHIMNKECEKRKKCPMPDCGVIWNVRANTREGRPGHVCGEHWCQTCEQFHNPERGCFIRTLKPVKQKDYRLVFFDFEAMQHEAVAAATTRIATGGEETCTDRRVHRVNFIGADVLCTGCIKKSSESSSNSVPPPECAICGPHRRVSFQHRAFSREPIDRQNVTTNPLRDFVHWLLYGFKNKKVETVAFSHFGGKYDMVMVLGILFREGITPELIRRGNKLYEVHVPRSGTSSEIYFRDSFNLCPVSLGQLVSAFGLNIEEKFFFPHFSNHPDNYDRTLAQLPARTAYLYGGFTRQKQQQFDRWYEAELEKGTQFNLVEELAVYCMNDVLILREALLAFREEFFQISDHQIDVLRQAMTIASASMKHFRTNHLQEDHLAIVPQKGYERIDNQSTLALKFLKWYAESHGYEHIRTAHSEGGEKMVGRYRLDGYIREEDRGIEINGCVWHGHDCLYDDSHNDRDFLLPNGKTVGAVRRRDAERLGYLRHHLKGGVDVFWECEIHEMCRLDPGMKAAFANYRDEGPIRTRDGFAGGRTGPFRLHYKAPSGYRIGYADFCSLYPASTVSTEYPVGHPLVHVMKGQQRNVNWSRPEDIPLKGLLKVFVVPPTHVDVPVLPVRFDQRLLFPLCRACAIAHPEGGVQPNYVCPHWSDQDRGWVSTCTHMELAEALKVGYRVTHYYRGWEWLEWDGDVFRNYVAQMMQMKIHASGFPDGIRGNPAAEDLFIRECLERFGIVIERDKMVANKVRRAIAKLLNNNLWGRFALRNDLSKTKFVRDPADLRRMLEDKKINVIDVYEVTDLILMVTYEMGELFIEENANSNLVLALWTTSAARCMLLRELQRVARTPGCLLLYCDTDSVMFAYPDNIPYPLPIGPHLGDLAVEYADCDLLEYVSGGCKAYSLRMLHRATGEERTVERVRGITLTADVAKSINFESFKRAVFKYAEPATNLNAAAAPSLAADAEEMMATNSSTSTTIVASYPNFIQPDVRRGRVTSRRLLKCYRPIVLKGVVDAEMIVRDFGYKP
jgi:hypothetical protein